MSRTLIGIISDTHGLLRPQAVDALRGCTRIIHAGDVCDATVLERLASLAPVTAVRGNNDRGAWAERLREIEDIDVDGVRIHVIHDLSALAIDPAARGVRVVISGHSHKPRCEERGGVMYLNPGSAGPRRFTLPVGVATLEVEGSRAAATLLTLDV